MAVSCCRISELEELIKRLENSGCIIIQGLPGMGKSVICESIVDLASKKEKWEHRTFRIRCRKGQDEKELFARFSDRICRILGDDAFKGREPGAETISELIEQNSLFCFLDDLHSIESNTILRLISFASNFKKGRLLVGTRKKPHLDPLKSIDIYHHTLQGLSKADAEKMICDLSAFQGKEITDKMLISLIHEKSAGHPFSIKVMTGLVLSGRLDRMILAERSETAREQMNQFLLSTAWEGLTKEAKPLLFRLSLIRFPMKPEFCLNDWQGAMDSRIIELQSKCMIEQDLAGRIWTHDIIRNFSLDLMNSNQLSKEHSGIADSLWQSMGTDMELAGECYFHYSKAGDAEKTRKALMMLARIALFIRIPCKNLTPVFQDAISLYDDPDLRLAYIMNLVDTFRTDEAAEQLKLLTQWRKHYIEAEISSLQGNHEDSRMCCEKALKTCDDEQFRILISIKIAKNLMDTGHSIDAFSEMKRIQEEFNITDFPLLEPLYFSYYTLIQAMGQKYRDAIKTGLKAEQCFIRIRAKGRLAELYGVMSILYGNSGMEAECEKYCHKTLDIADELELNMIRSRAVSQLATLSHSRNELEKALELFREACVMEEIRKDHGMTVYYLSKCGYISMELGRLNQAKESYSKATLLISKVQRATIFGWYACCFVPFHIVTGRLDLAEQSLMDALEKLEQLPRWHSDILACQIRISELSGKHDTAEKLKKDLATLKAESGIPDTVFCVDFDLLDKIIADLKNHVVFLTGMGRKLLSRKEIPEILSKARNFDILADFSSGRVFVDGEQVLKRRAEMTLLLREIACQLGEPVSIRSLCRKLWERKYDPEKDPGALRKNISRLRKGLDPDATERFILKSTGEGYRFNTESEYCIILDPTTS